VTAFAQGFSAIRVYLETLRAEHRASGLFTATTLGLRHSWNTARILFYVRQIQRQHRRGSYAYVDESSLSTLLSDRSLEPRVVERTLAGQCVTALAVARGR
jgi:hypothetical protein